MDIPGEVAITPNRSILGDVGESRLSLECSANITTDPFPPGVPLPFFTWLFAPNHTSFPEPISLQNFAVSIDNNTYSHTYTSTLTFPPLSVSHAGMYMCQLGGNEGLRASTDVIVNGIYSQ